MAASWTRCFQALQHLLSNRFNDVLKASRRRSRSDSATQAPLSTLRILNVSLHGQMDSNRWYSPVGFAAKDQRLLHAGTCADRVSPIASPNCFKVLATADCDGILVIAV